MAAQQFLVPGNHATVRGLVAPNATASLYTTGTLTPQPFYSDAGLSISLGSTITADAIGVFPLAYQDSATPFRLILKDATGATLDGGDINSYYFGQAVISLNANYITPLQYGGVADCTAVGTGTDNLAAFNAAIAAAGLHGTVYIPAGHYRLSGPLTLTNGIKLIGEGHSENPGTIGGTTYVPPLNYQGSVLVFDQNQPGLKLFDFTDNAANAQAFEFQGARYAVLEDFMLYGGGGTTVTAHGVDIKTVVRARNLRVHDFAGNGLNIVANTTGASTYGNADISRFDAVLTRANGCHGIFISGNESNAISFGTCSSMNNGGVGYLDKTTVGNNVFVGCHAASNNQSYGASSAARTQVVADWAGLSDQMAGSYVMTVGTENAYIGCYTESGTGSKAELLAPAQVIGGFLSETGSQTASFTAVYMNGGNNGILGNIAAITSGTGNLGLTGNLSITRSGNNVATLNLSPGGTQVYSQISLKGNGGSLALGMGLIGGSGSGNIFADNILLQNAAQTTTFGTWSASGLNMGAASALSFGGTPILNSSGVLQAAGFPALTGNVTTTAGSLATTIAAGVVTLAMQANMATGSLVYRKTAGSGAPEVNTLATLKTDLGLTGTNSGDQTITLTGNVTGSGTGSFATTIAASAVTRAMMANTAAATVLGSTAAGAVAELTAAQGRTVLGLATVASSGLASDLTGTLAAAQMPALTGDVTTSAGAVATTLATNIVTYAKFQQVAASSLVGNATGSLANAAAITLAGGLAFSGTTLTAAGALTPTSVASTGAITSSSATAGSGYATGAGGAVTQLTSRTTGVTLSKPCGAITLFSAAGSATWATFIVTNTLVAATDTIEISQKSGANLYNVIVTAVGAGSFNVSVSAVSGTATEAPVFNFVVTKAVAA